MSINTDLHLTLHQKQLHLEGLWPFQGLPSLICERCVERRARRPAVVNLALREIERYSRVNRLGFPAAYLRNNQGRKDTAETDPTAG